MCFPCNLEWRSGETPEVEHTVLVIFRRRQCGLHRFWAETGLWCSGRWRIYDIWYIISSSTCFFSNSILLRWFQGTIQNSWSWKSQVWNHDGYIYLPSILSSGISVAFLWTPVNLNIIRVTPTLPCETGRILPGSFGCDPSATHSGT